MAGLGYTTVALPVNDIVLSGGLNSTAGPLNVLNHESSDLQNIDFNKFGSIVKRNGYASLHATALNSSADINGLHQFHVNRASTVASLVAIAGSKCFKMDSLDGTWDNITSSASITTGYKFDFETFQNTLFFTNGNDNPLEWEATRTPSLHAAACVAAAGVTITKARCVEVFNNYLFYGNVTSGGTAYPSRIYYSNYKDFKTYTATDYIDIGLGDGQEITRLQVLGDRLVVFKTRSIYNVFFTGYSNVPFTLPNGGKSNSSVGCVAPFSVQEVDNGLVFLANDGFYFYDGLNSYKISDRITATLDTMAKGQYSKAVSMVQREKNRYWCALSTSGGSENDKVIVWDYFHNAWSIYDGLNPCSMAIVYVNNQERPYWGDYSGFVYRSDTGTDDYPLNVQTAIDAYYWTNWKHYGDVIDKKGISHMMLYYQIANTALTIEYAYDLSSSAQHSRLVSLDTSSDTWDNFNWDEGTWAEEGGKVMRVDLPSGRGRVVRFRFRNNIIGETFQIDGFGTNPHLETIA